MIDRFPEEKPFGPASPGSWQGPSDRSLVFPVQPESIRESPVKQESGENGGHLIGRLHGENRGKRMVNIGQEL
jgi:hypothetical protein